MAQVSFDPLDYSESAVIAKQARNVEYRRLVKEGKQARRWVLRGQLSQYAGFGQPDGRVRDVFYISY